VHLPIQSIQQLASVVYGLCATQSHWVSVVEQLQLDERQQLQAWLLADLYAGWHKRLMADRSVLTAQLAQMLNSQQQYSQVGGGSGLSCVVAQAHR
jgi:phytoene/squalene synthetase